MNAIERPRDAAFGAGHVAAAVIAAWIVYALIGGLDTIGRHFVVLGALRVVLFGALLAFALAVGAHTRRLGRVGLVVAGVGAAGYLLGAVGSVATDGWTYDVFADAAASPPWYAIVLGLSGILFALGTVLVGIAGRSGGRLAVAVILAGALFPAVLALSSVSHAAGHIIWLVPWMVLAAGLIAAPAERPGRALEPAQAR